MAVEENLLKNENKKNKAMRAAFIRVSAHNLIHKDNEGLNFKAGQVVEYKLDDILNTLKKWLKTKKFEYYVIEHNESKENKHFHIVISFSKKSSCKFSTLKNKFPLGHIDTCRTGVKNCVRYLCHADTPQKTQYPWDNIITNSPDKLEDYKSPNKPNIDYETKVILNKIVAGEIKEFEINKIPPYIYIKNRRKIENAFKYRREILLSNPNRNIIIICLQGEARIGKTTFCKIWAEKNNKSIAFSSASNDSWQDYKGQDIFVLDDFEPNSTEIEDFKKTLDPHTNTSNGSRYDNKSFIGDIIFICTNTPLTQWFTFSKDQSREAIFKRIDYVFDFNDYEKNYSKESNTIQPADKTYYTINRIGLTDECVTCSTGRNNAPTSYRKAELQPVDDNKRYFDLGKYIDLNADKTKREKFLEQLKEI